MKVNYQVHPAASVWPMLSEAELRDLANDIAENGQLLPVLIDPNGLVLDGRNRLAACALAGITPKVETYEGDPITLVLSAEKRRRQSTGQYAAGTALLLEMAGKRKDGRWERGSVPDVADNQTSLNSGAWSEALKRAGIILDHLGKDMLRRISDGSPTLDAAFQDADAKRKKLRLRKGLPDDLGALVDAGSLTIDDAIERSSLPPEMQARVASGELTTREAKTLDAQDKKDRDDGIRRDVSRVKWFIDGWDAARSMRDSAEREAILNGLDPYDRDRFLVIEKEELR